MARVRAAAGPVVLCGTGGLADVAVLDGDAAAQGDDSRPPQMEGSLSARELPGNRRGEKASTATGDRGAEAR